LEHIQVLEGDQATAAVAQLLQVAALAPGAEDGAPKVSLLKQDVCAIAPVVHSGTLTSEIAKKLFDAAKTTGDTTMTAIGLYSVEEQHCYSLSMTLEALEELRGTSCGVINFALLGENARWLVLFDTQLYIAYGPTEFVTALVGDIEGAYGAYQTKIETLMAEAKGDVPGYVVAEITRVSSYLQAALTKLQIDYAKAAAGEMVNVV